MELQQQVLEPLVLEQLGQEQGPVLEQEQELELELGLELELEVKEHSRNQHTPQNLYGFE